MLSRCIFSFFFGSIIALLFFVVFFFNDTATTEIYTLSLHDALPILGSSSEAGHRWATLALAWLGSARAPHLVGRRSTGTGPANALGPDVQWPAIRAIRREVLRELSSLEPGSAADHASLRQRLAWRRPNRSAAVLDEAVEAVLRESEWLGVTGRGALSEAGRALVAPLLPPPLPP